MKFIYGHQLEIFRVGGLECKKKLSSWIDFKCLAHLCLIALRYHQIFFISPIYQNTLYNIINMEFYHLNGSFLFSVSNFNFSVSLFPLFFFLCIQTLSWNGPNETFYIIPITYSINQDIKHEESNPTQIPFEFSHIVTTMTPLSIDPQPVFTESFHFVIAHV